MSYGGKSLHRVEEESNIVLTRKRKKVTWTGHTLCTKWIVPDRSFC